MNIASIERLLRYAGWLAIGLAVLVSVAPAGARPHTGFPGTVEHFLAYLGIAALLTAGYRGRVSAGVIAVLLSLAAINLEFIQFFIPGRQPGLTDAVASAAGAAAGATAARFTWPLLVRRRD